MSTMVSNKFTVVHEPDQVPEVAPEFVPELVPEVEKFKILFFDVLLEYLVFGKCVVGFYVSWLILVNFG